MVIGVLCKQNGDGPRARLDPIDTLGHTGEAFSASKLNILIFNGAGEILAAGGLAAELGETGAVPMLAADDAFELAVKSSGLAKTLKRKVNIRPVVWGKTLRDDNELGRIDLEVFLEPA